MKDHKTPPFLAEFFIALITDPVNRASVLGDLAEAHGAITRSRGSLYAYCWYWSHLFLSLPAFIKNSTIWSLIMFRNYMTTALRNIQNHKVHAAINIFGLSLGLACAILIYLFVYTEMTYDSFHENSDRIFMSRIKMFNEDGSLSHITNGAVPKDQNAWKDFFPEVEKTTRIGYNRLMVLHEDFELYEQIYHVDPDFFNILSFKFIAGDPGHALLQPQSVVLTEEYAQKIFGKTDVIGEKIELTQGTKHEFTITGITENRPVNSSIRYNIVLDYNSQILFGGNIWQDNDHSIALPLYILTSKPHDDITISPRLDAFRDQYFADFIEKRKASWHWDSENDLMAFELQKLEDYHNDTQMTGMQNLSELYTLSGIAAIILLIACINFTNLSTGRSSMRSKEIGVRKVFGAQKNHLVKQFLTESEIAAFVSLIIGIGLAYLMIPSFGELSRQELRLSDLFSLRNIITLILITLFTGFAAGLYPAIILSGFRPVEILKGKLKVSRAKLLAMPLVTFQFVLSICLIILSVVFAAQLRFMTKKYPGFEKDGIIYLQLIGYDKFITDSEHDILKSKLLRHSSIKSATSTSIVFGYGFREGGFRLDDNDDDMYTIDYNTFEMFDINLIEGKSYSKESPPNAPSVFVNEAYVKKHALSSPIGKEYIAWDKKSYEIIGIINNLHVYTLKEPVISAVYLLNEFRANSIMYLKVDNNDLSSTIKYIELSVKELRPTNPVHYSFLDDDLRAQYEEEMRWGRIVNFSTILAVLIACLGIFGLTSLTISRRIKEIGIRKVLGAKVLQIVKLIVREIVLVVCIANVIAAPIAWYVLDKVLQNYYYRIEVVPTYFIITFMLSLGIALLTVMFIALKAAYANSVDSLRYE